MEGHSKRRSSPPTTQGVLYIGSPLTKPECKRRLEWMFTFLQQDTAAMGKAEFTEWIFQALSFLYGDYYDDPKELRRLCEDTSRNRAAVRQIQERVALFMHTLTMGINRSRNYSRPALVGRGNMEVEVIIRDGASYLMPVPGLRPSFRKVSLTESISGSRRSLSKAVPLSTHRQKRILERVKHPEDCILLERAFDLDISRSLSIAVGAVLNAYGIPKIRRCPNCRAYFMHTAAKKTRLCRRCYSKRNTTEWRKRPENRDAYNTYQMHRRKGVDKGGPAAIRDRATAKNGN